MTVALRLGFISMLCFVVSAAGGQTKNSRLDSIQSIDEVVVLSRLTFREVIPSHSLNGEQLKRLNSHNVADALRYFAGLQLKDYGGVGGIKTANIRSMGTNHLGIFYDGVELGNAQNGQVDLGQLSLDNVEEITLYNGQKSAIFQPASEFGNAGSVYIRTRRPRFAVGESSHLRLNAMYGSSDMARLSALWEQKISSAVSSSLSAGFLSSSGKYDFRYRRLAPDGTVAYDTTATRSNGDIWALRAEANVCGVFGQGAWNIKAYTYNSGRGIPGAIVNNVWRRGEHQWDHNTFTQASVQKSIGNIFSTRLLAKYAYYNTHYINRDTTTMMTDNRYRQQELYISSSNVFEILPAWSASAAYDFRWNKLDSDMRQFVAPHRFTNAVSIATAYNRPLFNIQGSLLATWVKDHARRLAPRSHRAALVPAVFANVFPLGNKILSVRAYAKRSYRMPTFNDLFYTDIGNADLKPESALQYDLGFVLERNFGQGFVRHLRWQTDAYYNSVRDKIVAYPKGQQFRWTMLNLGRVHIKGIDIEAETTVEPIGGLLLTARVQYTYQDARDVTDARDTYYRDQIPYIPWHSGSAIVGIAYRNWTLNYSFIYAGKRYNQQENTRYNYMQPWYTNDLSASCTFRLGGKECRLNAELNNFLSQDYEVILNYPMPKVNFRIGATVEI